MTDKKKEAAEIKQVLINTCKRCRTLQEDYMQDRYAESLVRAKYRKADVVEKETAQKILRIIEERLDSVNLCFARSDGYHESAFGYDVEQVDNILADLTKEYGED